MGDFKTPLSPIDWSFRPILELNDNIDQIDLTNIYRVFHPTTPQYTFFSAAHGISLK
jgi:hypothetical protein